MKFKYHELVFHKPTGRLCRVDLRWTYPSGTLPKNYTPIYEVFTGYRGDVVETKTLRRPRFHEVLDYYSKQHECDKNQLETELAHLYTEIAHIHQKLNSLDTVWYDAVKRYFR